MVKARGRVLEPRRSSGRQLRHRIALMVGDPDMGAVHGDRIRVPKP
jgi:hypothetical protein